MTKIFQYILFILLIASSCVDPYWPDLKTSNSNTLVVDALITDNPDDQQVKLSISSPLNDQHFIPVDSATVNVKDDLGNNIPFHFSGDGLYTPDNFTGIPGRSYKLLINMTDGNQYESDYQTLQTVEPFDSVYYSIDDMPTTDPTVNIEGAQFYIDYPSNNTDTYYLIQLEETYEYKPDLRLYYMDTGDGPEIASVPQPLKCWKTSLINKFFISRSLVSGNAPERSLPLHFVPFDTKQFSVRYSLLIKQIAVSEEIYNFYYEINQQNNSGSLYASQPYTIQGNVHCITNPGEKVLGSFVAGSIYQKRTFYNSPAKGHFTYDVCDPVTDGPSLGGIMAAGGTLLSPLYFTLVNGRIGWAPDKCFFCAMAGGLTEKPDFWVDQ